MEYMFIIKVKLVWLGKQLNWFFHGKNAVSDNRENNDD